MSAPKPPKPPRNHQMVSPRPISRNPETSPYRGEVTVSEAQPQGPADAKMTSPTPIYDAMVSAIAAVYEADEVKRISRDDADALAHYRRQSMNIVAEQQ